MVIFSDFQYCFRSSRSTADLLAVVSDRITRAFNRSGATRAVVRNISNAFDRVWYAMLVCLTNLSLKEFQVRYLALFPLFSVIDGFGSFWMENLHNKIQLMLKFRKALFLDIHIFYYLSMTFPLILSVILRTMLILLLSTISVNRHLICGNN